MDAQAPKPNSPDARDDAIAVLTRLRDTGHLAYFAGGCVRDELLGLAPKDYDIATDAPPDRVRKLFTQTQAVGAAFGVILVRHRQSIIEVATFRSDGNYADGRRPQTIQFTSAAEDANRRDFTINGLFLDPTTNQIIDHVGGQSDLQSRTLRAIGNPAARFAEDHLRILRGVRFAARFQLQIDDATARAMSAHAPHLTRISPERIGDELRLMLTPTTRITAWHLLHQLNITPVLFRFLPVEKSEKMVAVACISASVPSNTGGPPVISPTDACTFASVAPDHSIGFGFALAATGLDYQWGLINPSPDIRPLLAKPAVQALSRACRKAMKISNDEQAQLEQSLLGLDPLLAEDEPSVAVMKRFLARSTARESRELLSAINQIGLHQSRIAWLNDRLGELEQTDCSPPPLLTGDDLVARDHPPGPAFKRILDAVYDAQLEDRIQTPAQAVDLAEAMFTDDASAREPR